jgi:hypothetical protein
MQTKSRRNLIINTTQIVVWVAVFLIPAIITWVTTRSLMSAWSVFSTSTVILLPYLVLYSINYYYLIPKFLYGGRAKWFYIVNVVLLLAYDAYKFIPRDNMEMPQEVIDQFGENSIWALYVGGVFILLFMQIMVILMAVGIRSVMRSNEARMQLEEEKRKSAEAELVWLKHQLNPHFLFNTLNNISSLTQIDPDKAQESIGQLSDLLRYALYDSEAEKVSLASEMEFMSNYVDLMALRCNELTTVTKEFQVPQGSIEVAPLLFISLVENAFKHGVNARYPSFVKVKMYYQDGKVWFMCSNSVFNNKGTETGVKSDHIGSGIGLENMKRRLELLYPGRYTYEQKIENDTYIVTVEIDV